MKQKPFTFGVFTSGDNFTDRVEETRRTLMNFQYGINTILISPRRWGKTSLVKKVISMAQSKDLKIVYIDIFSCRNEQDFYDLFVTSIIKQTASKLDELTEGAKQFLSNITPKFAMGLDPMSELSLSFSFNYSGKNIEEILQLPEKIAQKKKCNIVVCIDEFQQINEFKDSKTFQKRLRSFWQLQERTSYCLFGSKKHLMNELFEKKSLPFYKFGDIMHLQKIGTEDWTKYICKQFERTGKHIPQSLAREICLTVDNHSSYVQQLSWLLWARTERDADAKDLEYAIQDIIDQNTPLFEKQMENLTSYQMSYLKAILNEDAYEMPAQKLIEKYDLKSSANITAIKKALIKKEIIDSEKKKSVIPDPIMKKWLQKRMAG